MNESYLTDLVGPADPEVAAVERRLVPLLESAPPLRLDPQARGENHFNLDATDMYPLATPTTPRRLRVGLVAATITAAAAAAVLFTTRAGAPDGGPNTGEHLAAATAYRSNEDHEGSPAPPDLEPGLSVDVWSVIRPRATHVVVVPGWDVELPEDGASFMSLRDREETKAIMKGGKDALDNPRRFDVPPGRYTVCAQLEEHSTPALGAFSEPDYAWAPRCRRIAFDGEAEAVAIAFWELPEGWRELQKSPASDPLFEPYLDGTLVEHQGLVVIPDLIYAPYALGVQYSRPDAPRLERTRSSIGRVSGHQPVFAWASADNGDDAVAPGKIEICLKLSTERGAGSSIGVLAMHSDAPLYNAACKTVEITNDEASRLVVFSDDPEHPMRP